MTEIDKIDKNFKIETTLSHDDLKYRNCEEAPFRICGVFREGDAFKRLPASVAKATSDGVFLLHTSTAGGRIRFRTNSKYVAIKAKMPRVYKNSHMALTGSAGFDLYAKLDGKDTYFGAFIPPFDISDGYESSVSFPTAEMREVTIGMPLYSAVSELYIGVQESAELLPAEDYKLEKPIVYYGSSITQGACASRPGNSYQAIVSRYFDANYVNLGFSGRAKAEETIMDYIKGLDMSVFVYDYDHNATTTEELENTHERGFLKVRGANPDLPIIMMSRPKFYLNGSEPRRVEIIRTTYNNALGRGDKNVYFIEGPKLMDIALNEGTVDNCHPNDLGFYSMAQPLIEVLKGII